MIAHTWSTMKNMLGHVHHFPVLLFHLHCSFFSLHTLSSISSLFHLIAPSRCGRPCYSLPNTHREQGAVLILREGLHIIFSLYYTFQRRGQSLLLGRRRLRGDFTSKPVEAAFSRLAPRGLRGILECRGMY